MPRSCTICTHPQRPAVDKALVAGEPYRNIANRTGTSVAALQRHKTEHVPVLLAQAQQREARRGEGLAAQVQQQEAREERQALDILQQLKVINASSMAVLRDARDAGDGELALKAVDRIHRQIELQAKLLGELDERPQINVLISPEWLVVRTTLLQALAPYSDARLAVVARLGALEATNGHRG